MSNQSSPKKNRHVAKILGLLTPLLNVWFICFQSEVTRLQEQIDTEVRVRKDLDEKVEHSSVTATRDQGKQDSGGVQEGLYLVFFNGGL